MMLVARFGFASLILIAIYGKKLLQINSKMLKAGIIMGVFLFLEFLPLQ